MGCWPRPILPPALCQPPLARLRLSWPLGPPPRTEAPGLGSGQKGHSEPVASATLLHRPVPQGPDPPPPGLNSRCPVVPGWVTPSPSGTRASLPGPTHGLPSQRLRAAPSCGPGRGVRRMRVRAQPCPGPARAPGPPHQPTVPAPASFRVPGLWGPLDDGAGFPCQCRAAACKLVNKPPAPLGRPRRVLTQLHSPGSVASWLPWRPAWPLGHS